MEERLNYLREKLHEAIAEGDKAKILKASEDLDVEIVNAMRTLGVCNEYEKQIIDENEGEENVRYY